jgi:hypothetical protein
VAGRASTRRAIFGAARGSGQGPAQPRRHPADVHRHLRGHQVGVAHLQRVDDGPVLGERALHRALLGQPAPHPGPQGAAGQGVQQPGEVGVPGPLADVAVEDDVVGHQLVHRGHAVDLGEQLAQVGDVRPGHPRGGQHRGGRLEDPAHLEQLEDRVVLVHVDDEGQRVQQQAGAEAGDVGPVAAAHVQHADDLQRLDRLAQRAARQPQRLAQLLLRRQPVARLQVAREDHFLDLQDRLVGQRHPASLGGIFPRVGR